MSTKFMKSAFVGWTFTAGLYYPPDFDSTKLTPLKNLRPKGQQQTMNIRMMFPFTMICDTCHEYNHTGLKFTARVEDIKSEKYLGLKVYRFYGRCRHCFAEFTFKTDPKNSDYTMESGGKRTYEAWKDADMMEAQMKAEKEREAELDQMKALEQKSVDVQAEMQRLEDLDAIRTMNKRLGARDQTIEDALEFLFKKSEKEEALEDRLGSGELEELKGFREAQEERKRQQLEDEVEGGGEDALEGLAPFGGASSSSASSSSGSAVPAAGVAAGSSSAGGVAAGAAIAAAIAERAGKQSRARPKLSVKKKDAPADAGTGGDDESRIGGDAKRQCMESSGASAAASKGASASDGSAKAPAAVSQAGDGEASAGGMMGLGAYDSDDSS